MAGKDFFVHPLKRKNRGLRSGRPLLKDGKVIKRDKDGYEVLDDYFSESDVEHTLELHKSSIELHKSIPDIDDDDDRIIQSQPTPVSHRLTRNRNFSSYRSVASSVTSKLSNSSSGYNPVGWLLNKNYGRRTGKDIKAGKVIRKRPDGFEEFDDYWSESDADSLMLSKLSESTKMESPMLKPEELPASSEAEITAESGTEESENTVHQHDHLSSEDSSQDGGDTATNSVLLDSHAVSQNLTKSDLHTGRSALKRQSKEVLSERNKIMDSDISPNKIMDKSKRHGLSKGSHCNVSFHSKSLNMEVSDNQASKNQCNMSSTESDEYSVSEVSKFSYKNQDKDNSSRLSESHKLLGSEQTASVTQSSFIESDPSLGKENETPEPEENLSLTQKSNVVSTNDTNNGKVSESDSEKKHNSQHSILIQRKDTGHSFINKDTAVQDLGSGEETKPTLINEKKSEKSFCDSWDNQHTEKSKEEFIGEGKKQVQDQLTDLQNSVRSNISLRSKSSSTCRSEQNSNRISPSSSTLTRVTYLRGRSKSLLSQNELSEVSTQRAEQLHANTSLMSKITSSETIKTVREKSLNTMESSKPRQDSNTLCSVSMSRKSFVLSDTSFDSVVIVDDDDVSSKNSDNMKNKSLKSKPSRKSKSMKNNLDISETLNTSEISQIKSIQENTHDVTSNSHKSTKNKKIIENAEHLIKDKSLTQISNEDSEKNTLFSNATVTGNVVAVEDNGELYASVHDDNKCIINLQKENPEIPVQEEQRTTRQSKKKKKGTKSTDKVNQTSNKKYSLRSEKKSSNAENNEIMAVHGQDPKSVVSVLEDLEKNKDPSAKSSKSQEESHSTEKSCLHDENGVFNKEVTLTSITQGDPSPTEEPELTGATMMLPLVDKSQSNVKNNKSHGISQMSQAASIVIGGNVTGSLTKVESNTVGGTPSFRTRKRLSYSVAALDSSQFLNKKKRQSVPQLPRESAAIEDHPLNPYKKTFVFDENSDSDASTNFLFLSHNVDKTNLKTVDDEIENFNGGPINITSGEDNKKRAKKSGTAKKKTEAKKDDKKPVQNAAGKKRKGRKKKQKGSKNEVIASSSHEDQLESAVNGRDVMNQKSSNRVTNNTSKTNYVNSELDTEKIIASDDQQANQIDHFDIETTSDNEEMCANEKETYKNRRKTTGNIGGESKAKGGKNREKDMKTRRSTPNFNLSNSKTNINLVTVSQNLEKIQQQQNKMKIRKKSFVFDSTDNSVVDDEDEGRGNDIDLPQDELGHQVTASDEKFEAVNTSNIVMEQDVENEHVTAEKASIVEEKQMTTEESLNSVEKQVTRGEHNNVEEKQMTTQESLNSDDKQVTRGEHNNVEEKQMTTQENSNIEQNPMDVSITRRLSFSGEKKNKKKNAKKGRKNKRKNTSLQEGSPSKIKNIVKESDITTETMTTPVTKQTLKDTKTPDAEVSASILHEEAMKSGISFRHKRRTMIIQEEVDKRDNLTAACDEPGPNCDVPDSSDHHIINQEDDDTDGKIPNIIRRRSSIKYAPVTDPISLTPCIVKSKTTRKNKERRVTISRKVIETSYDAINSSGSSGNSLDQTGTTTDGPPVHIFEMTNSQTPDRIQNPHLNKIISPEPAPDGLRRSKRTRVKTLDSYKLERPIYERRKSGGFAIIGIKPSLTEGKLKALELKRKNRLKSRDKTRKNRRLSGRRLSTHAELPSTLHTTISTEITVHNPDSNDDVLLECIGTKEQAVKFGPKGQECMDGDPFFMTRSLSQPAFGAGMLQIKGLMEKPVQIITKGSLIFHVIFGKILVTIESTSVILSTNDSFFVPRGNRYSIKNLRKDDAKLSYVLLKFDESEEELDVKSD